MIEQGYLHQLFLRPDLNGLHLLWGLSLNAIGVEEDLQSERHKQDKDDLYIKHDSVKDNVCHYCNISGIKGIAKIITFKSQQRL